MTAPAAAPVSGAIVAPTPRAAPQVATDRFAFAAMLDSLPGAAAKTASSAAEEGSQTSNEPKQGQSPSGQSDGHPMLGDGALLSSLPFALAASQAPAAAADASLLAQASTEGARTRDRRRVHRRDREPGGAGPGQIDWRARLSHRSLDLRRLQWRPFADRWPAIHRFAVARAGAGRRRKRQRGARTADSRAALDARPWADA